MPKIKPKRNKKYVPRRPTIPAWTLDAIGQLSSDDLNLIQDAVNTDLNLMHLGTWDKSSYANILFSLKHFWAFSKNFDNKKENELLATMATASVHAIFDMIKTEREGKPKNPLAFESSFEPLEHAVQTYFAMMRESFRSEHETARREASKMNLTNELEKVAVGGIALIFPENDKDARRHVGQKGVAYVHGRCENGCIDAIGDSIFWKTQNTNTLIRIEKPILAFFLEKTPENQK